MDGISQFVWIFFFIITSPHWPKCWGRWMELLCKRPYYVTGTLHTYTKHYSLVFLTTKTISRTSGESTTLSTVFGSTRWGLWHTEWPVRRPDQVHSRTKKIRLWFNKKASSTARYTFPNFPAQNGRLRTYMQPAPGADSNLYPKL